MFVEFDLQHRMAMAHVGFSPDDPNTAEQIDDMQYSGIS